MAPKLKKSLRKVFLEMLAAPLDEWDFKTTADRDAWIAKQIKAAVHAQNEIDKPKQKKAMVKPSKVPTFPSSR